MKSIQQKLLVFISLSLGFNFGASGTLSIIDAQYAYYLQNDAYAFWVQNVTTKVQVLLRVEDRNDVDGGDVVINIIDNVILVNDQILLDSSLPKVVVTTRRCLVKKVLKVMYECRENNQSRIYEVSAHEGEALQLLCSSVPKTTNLTSLTPFIKGAVGSGLVAISGAVGEVGAGWGTLFSLGAGMVSEAFSP